MTQTSADDGLTTLIAPAFTAQAPPGGSTNSIITRHSPRLRTLITYAGTVTAANVRLWFRSSVTGAWYRGASTDDLDPLTPASGNESRDWDIGRNVEVCFTLESVAPGTSGNTVAVAAIGVDEP